MAVALEGEDVGRQPVEEPAVVADDDRAAGKILQRFFERAQRVHVEVVGRLVQQQHVVRALQHLRQVHAVALAAREHADRLLLVAALEVEGGAIGARRHAALAHGDLVHAVGDFLPDGLAVVEAVAALVDIAELDALADGQRAAIGLVDAGDHLEQRGLAGAVRADHADDAAGRQLERQVVDQQPVAEALAELVGDDDGIAEARRRRDLDLGRVGRLLEAAGQQVLVLGDAGL